MMEEEGEKKGGRGAVEVCAGALATGRQRPDRGLSMDV